MFASARKAGRCCAFLLSTQVAAALICASLAILWALYEILYLHKDAILTGAFMPEALLRVLEPLSKTALNYTLQVLPRHLLDPPKDDLTLLTSASLFTGLTAVGMWRLSARPQFQSWPPEVRLLVLGSVSLALGLCVSSFFVLCFCGHFQTSPNGANCSGPFVGSANAHLLFAVSVLVCRTLLLNRLVHVSWLALCAVPFACWWFVIHWYGAIRRMHNAGMMRSDTQPLKHGMVMVMTASLLWCGYCYHRLFGNALDGVVPPLSFVTELWLDFQERSAAFRRMIDSPMLLLAALVVLLVLVWMVPRCKHKRVQTTRCEMAKDEERTCVCLTDCTEAEPMVTVCGHSFSDRALHADCLATFLLDAFSKSNPWLRCTNTSNGQQCPHVLSREDLEQAECLNGVVVAADRPPLSIETLVNQYDSACVRAFDALLGRVVRCPFCKEAFFDDGCSRRDAFNRRDDCARSTWYASFAEAWRCTSNKLVTCTQDMAECPYPACQQEFCRSCCLPWGRHNQQTGLCPGASNARLEGDSYCCCANCDRIYERIDGCNVMRCDDGCGQFFCFLCGQTLDSQQARQRHFPVGSWSDCITPRSDRVGFRLRVERQLRMRMASAERRIRSRCEVLFNSFVNCLDICYAVFIIGAHALKSASEGVVVAMVCLFTYNRFTFNTMGCRKMCLYLLNNAPYMLVPFMVTLSASTDATKEGSSSHVSEVTSMAIFPFFLWFVAKVASTITVELGCELPALHSICNNAGSMVVGALVRGLYIQAVSYVAEPLTTGLDTLLHQAGGGLKQH